MKIFRNVLLYVSLIVLVASCSPAMVEFMLAPPDSQAEQVALGKVMNEQIQNPANHASMIGSIPTQFRCQGGELYYDTSVGVAVYMCPNGEYVFYDTERGHWAPGEK